MDYRNKNILAPMVRIGTLPTRLLCLDYGADIVYSEEIIDFKLLQCSRKENAVLGTVDFVISDGTVVFRTCDKEKGRVVFQMGTSNAKRAVKVAKMIEGDVAAIDINMGCPKEFSIKGGMGAALLDKPDTAKEILTELVKAVKIPVTCKIRMKNSLEETIEFARMAESTGIAAIGVHGRQRDERPRHQCRNEWIGEIVKALTIPVIANGGSNEIKTYEDIDKFKTNSGCSSVMIARAAEWNPSVYCSKGPEPIEVVVRKLMKYAVEYKSNLPNAKYCVQNIYHERLETDVGQGVLQSGTLRELCAVFEMTHYFDEVANYHKEKELQIQREHEGTDPLGVKKRRLDDGTELHEMALKFNRNHYNIQLGPKLILYNHSHTLKYPNPTYESIRNEHDRKFYSVVTFGGKKYASTITDMSKKWAEQSAAVVALRVLGLDDGRKQSVLEDPSVNTDLHMSSARNENGAARVKSPGVNENEAVRENSSANENEDSGDYANCKTQSEKTQEGKCAINNCTNTNNDNGDGLVNNTQLSDDNSSSMNKQCRIDSGESRELCGNIINDNGQDSNSKACNPDLMDS